ncbi:hypothetical protein EBS02_02015 [bacterium]|nr:hypothetical protein [bacterium]
MKDQIAQAFEEKFLCSDKFSQKVETLVKQYNITYIDAIIQFCEDNSLEIESVPKLMTKPLKEKLKCEAIQLNFLKKTSRAMLKF